MTIMRFFSDPHEGRLLKTNTTPNSRATLAEQVHLHAMQAVDMPHPAGKEVHYTVCGGDLFDTDTNPEHVLLSGAKVAAKCNLVLGGNHDVTNIANRECTLSALAVLTDESRFVLPPNPGKTRFDYRLVQENPFHVGDVALYSVPHHARQQEFDKALDEALADAKKFDKVVAEGKKLRRLLLVHCNYNLRIEAGENDLNLSDARARLMLQTFDYIVMGHDHRPRRECEGRLIIMGNTHPTSFSDQGDKRVWFYDSETNSWESVLNTEHSSTEIHASDLIKLHKEGGLDTVAAFEWIDVTGVLPPESAADLGRAIRALWGKSTFIYAIRMSKVLFVVEGQTNDQPVGASQKTLIEIVEEQLESSPDLLQLFREARTAEE